MDLFATKVNKQTQVFCSCMFSEGAYHVDTMTISWKGLQAYAMKQVDSIALDGVVGGRSLILSYPGASILSILVIVLVLRNWRIALFK